MKLLVVDDDATNRAILRKLLEKDNHEVVIAENGLQAVERFKTEHPDMVLMDIMMPEMNGYEATRIIKEKCVDKFVPVIFLTAMSDEEAIEDCVESGGDDFLTKPYFRSSLRAKIHAMARIKQLYTTIKQQKDELTEYQEYIRRNQKIAERIFSNLNQQNDINISAISNLHLPADTLNGDIVLARRRPATGINLMVGDFTGHGLAAAIGALPASEIFYSMTAKGFGIQEIIPEINKRLNSLLPTGMFLAACLVQIDNGTISVWNGGLPEALVISNNGDKIKHRFISSHLPLGVVDISHIDVTPVCIPIDDGDRVILYSDGVVEVCNDTGAMFGQGRFEEIITQTKTPGELIQRVNSALETFRNGGKQTDDITLLEYTCNFGDLEEENVRHINVCYTRPPSHWRIQLELDPETLRNADPLPLVIQMLMDIQSLHAHRGYLFTILSELFNNALDHGLLNLDSGMKDGAEGFYKYFSERENQLAKLESGFIRLEIKNYPHATGGRILIKVEDSGKGFNYEKMMPNLAGNMMNSGRGIPLVRSLCTDLIYYGCGNYAEAIYDW